MDESYSDAALINGRAVRWRARRAPRGRSAAREGVVAGGDDEAGEA
ncbi:hypothetical protein [Halorubrum gandharaense]